MKIGILGGTFDPIHSGHLKIAQAAAGSLKLDKLIFMPCFIPPHKTPKNITAAEHRLEMIRLAINSYPNYEVSDYEIAKGGSSFSIDTISEFKQAHPNDQIFFIIGSDSLIELSSWKNGDRIPEVASLAVVKRPSYEYKTLPQGVIEVDMEPTPVSSSHIRLLLKEGKALKNLVPQKVAKYILEHKLYA